MHIRNVILADPAFIARPTGGGGGGGCVAYTPGQASTIYTGDLIITTQGDVDLLAGYDGFTGNLTVDGENGAVGLNWTPLAGLKEIVGTLSLPGYQLSDLPDFPALKYVSGAVSVTRANADDTAWPAGKLDALAHAGSLYISLGMNPTSFNMDGCFPDLHEVTQGIDIDINLDYNFSAAGGSASMVGCFPCLLNGSVRLKSSTGSGPATLNLQGAFDHLVSTQTAASFGLWLGDWNITNVTGAFPVLATINDDLDLRPFPNGSLIPSFSAVTSVEGHFHIQQAVGVDFSAAFTNLASVGGYVFLQQMDSSISPPFTALASIGPATLVASLSKVQMSDNVNFVAPLFPALTSLQAGIQIWSNTFQSPGTWVNAFPLLTQVNEDPAFGGSIKAVDIQQNIGLSSIDGFLANATDIDSVFIDGNNDLVSMTGAFNSLAVGNSFDITNNTSLPTTAQAQAVIDHIVNVNSYPGSTTNLGNGPG